MKMNEQDLHLRIEALDWLRGLMAISIMVYHLTKGVFYELNSSTLLGRLGIYGVSVFFILSGLSMSIVYSHYISDFKTSVNYFIRRVFRIWPLLWICIALIVIPDFLSNKKINFLIVMANMTTLFGFIKPTAYINTGAWSIGNEMVYYAITPVIIMLYNKKIILGNIFTGLTFVIFLIFTFILLDNSKTLASQWSIYVNPFNNFFLYSVGIFIFYNFKDFKIPAIINLLLLSSSLLFLSFYPVSGDHINIVTNYNRLLFVLFSIILVFSFYKFNSYQAIPSLIKIPLEKFGIATYGVYLLHPIVSFYIIYSIKKNGIIDDIFIFIISMIISVVLALISYNYFEKKFIELGKIITKNNK